LIFFLIFALLESNVLGQLQIDGDELVLMTGDEIRSRKVRSTDDEHEVRSVYQ